LINGKFPDYERIIPKRARYAVKLPKKRFSEAIKLITTVSQDVQIIFEENLITFKSLTSDNMNAKTEIVLHTGVPHFELNVNSRYLLDFISQVENLEFEILLNEPTLPFVLKDKKFLTVIMPIIV
jgi:DNA polymerase-3 subunit beta